MNSVAPHQLALIEVYHMLKQRFSSHEMRWYIITQSVLSLYELNSDTLPNLNSHCSQFSKSRPLHSKHKSNSVTYRIIFFLNARKE